MRSLIRSWTALVVFAAWAPCLEAQIVYTFEPPNFVALQTTPILNAIANVGSPAFRTDFTSSPNPNGFQIANFQPNFLTMGQVLYIPTGAFTLTMTFNQPVSSLVVDFAVINPGYLRLMEGAQIVDQLSGMVGGAFQGGTLTYNKPGGFSTVTLAGFTLANIQEEFAIDNLRLTPVPEPGSVVLVGLALSIGYRRLKRPS